MKFIVKTTDTVFVLFAESVEVTEDGSILLFRNESDQCLLTIPRDNFKSCLRDPELPQ